MHLANSLTERWWVFVVRGVIAILFGILCFVQPELSLTTLVLMFGSYAIADGVLGVYVAVTGRKELEDWWVLLLWGLIGIAAGVLTFAAPSITALILLFYIAAWAVVSGVLQIALAIRLRKEIEGELFLVLAGILSIGFGLILMARPGDGALAVVWIIGVYAVAHGITLAVLGMRLRSFRSRVKERLANR
ncbi:MAG: HdeD family acid-resistance protein [Planctomycetia bacterium]|nr:HdeD family acid-resistance protein [Planctomycetia bacterium]